MCKQKFILIFNLLVLFAVFEARASTIPTSAVGECGPSQFWCSNGRCIESRSRCDQELDCLDGSDEVGCDQEVNNTHVFDDNSTTVNSTINNIQNLTNLNPSNCTQDEFPCQVGGCVLSSARCNGTSECPDGSDKTNCTSPILPSSSTKKLRKRKFPKKTSNETNDAYEATLRLLEEGDREIELRPDYHDVILVAGLTGAGKTTITKFITNPQDLEAYDAGERILIRDRVNNSISVNSTIVSKTIFPQLLIHGPSNTAFYDLPGFSDTRNATIEIGNAFFMKKVAEHAKRVKILLVVSHNTLRSAGTRIEFKTLIENLIKFVKDIRKFAQGVVLVASKVEDRRPNDRVIHFVGGFLKGVEEDLDQIFQDPEKLRHARAFLSVLLEKDEDTGKYKRIGIFKQPREVGPLMNNSDFTTNQNQVQNLVLRKAQFVPTSPGDFGFGVSADSTLFAKTLATKTKKKVDLLLEELTEVIEEELFEYPGNSSDSSPWPLLKKWTRDHSIFHQMKNALYDVGNCAQFFQVLNDTLSVFSIPGADEVILDLFKLNEQVEFFEKIIQKPEAPPQNWIDTLDDLETRVEKKTNKLAEELNNHVLDITSAISKSLKEQTESFMPTANATRATESNNSLPHQTVDTKTLFEHLTEDFNSINRMLSQLLTTSNFAQFSNITLSGLQNTRFKVPPSISTSLENIAFDMNFNSGINGQRFPFKLDSWVKDIELFSVFLKNQILTLSFHLSEEAKRQNEAQMKEQLRVLDEKMKLAEEKAEEEKARLALEHQQREESLNGSIATLADSLARARREQKQERDQLQAQLDLSKKSFTANLTQMIQDRKDLQEQIVQSEKNVSAILTQLNQKQKDDQRDREALETSLQEQKGLLNQTLVQLNRERQQRLDKEAEEKREKERLQEEKKNQEAAKTRLEEQAKQRKRNMLDTIRTTGKFPKSEKFSYSNPVSIERASGYFAGSWDYEEYCPENSIVTGFEVTYVPYQGSYASNIFRSRSAYDDQGIIGIKLHCTDVFNQRVVRKITSGSSSHQQTSTVTGTCPDHNPAIGFDIKNEPFMDYRVVKDNFGTINFRLICSDPETTRMDPDITYDTIKTAYWSEAVMCPPLAAVCGLQTKLAPDENDSSGVTNVRLKCCKIEEL